MKPETTASLVPPRPMLDPEPWPEPQLGLTLTIGLGVAFALVAVTGVALLWTRRHRPSRRRANAAANTPGGREPATPGDRLVSRVEQVRACLIERFGPSWAARTTEEIAASAELTAALGPDRAATLTALLRLADEAKFAREAPELDEQTLAPYSDAWLAEIQAGLDATTTIKAR